MNHPYPAKGKKRTQKDRDHTLHHMSYILIALTVSMVILKGLGAPAHATPPCDFMLSVSPQTETVAQGDTADFTLSITFSDPSYEGTSINVQATGLGPGMDFEQLPSGDMGILTSTMTTPGDYQISLMATGCNGAATHEVDMELTVTQAATTPVTTPTQINVTVTAVETTTVTNVTTSIVNQTVTSTVTTPVFGSSDITTVVLAAVAVAALVFAVYMFMKRHRSQLGAAPPPPTMPPPGMIHCPKCGHLNDPDAVFCVKDGTPLQHPAAVQTPPPVVAPTPPAYGVVIMPDRSEIQLWQGSRVFGRGDFMRLLKPEDADEISRSCFTITQEGDSFYIRDGGPDPNNPNGWKPSVNRTTLNGMSLGAGEKRRLNDNDLIDVASLGLNMNFKTRPGGA